jgi:hypothetical protein
MGIRQVFLTERSHGNNSSGLVLFVGFSSTITATAQLRAYSGCYGDFSLKGIQIYTSITNIVKTTPKDKSAIIFTALETHNISGRLLFSIIPRRFPPLRDRSKYQDVEFQKFRRDKHRYPFASVPPK